MDCLQVMRRSVRSWNCDCQHVLSKNNDAKCCQVAKRAGALTMPVTGSTWRERVSTAITCGVFSFQGQYFRQLLIETSSQE